MPVPALGLASDRFLSPNRLVFITGVIVIYAALFIALDGLRFEIGKDEKHFWPTSIEFSQRLIPTIDQLRSYDELNTPLPFVLFGALERVFGGGVFAGRLLNLTLSFAILLLVGWGRPNDWRPVLAAIGLLCCPYYLGASGYLYTDMIAVFFVVVGLWLHHRSRYIAAGVCFALGIASRQYMVAFPVAAATYEFVCSIRTTNRPRLAWIAPGIAALTLLGWIWLFGGLAPAGALTKQPLATATLLHLRVDHMLYFLTSVGAYFVIPETMLFRRWSNLTALVGVRAAVIAVLLLGLFVLFPPFNNPADYPIPTMGYLDRAARLVLNDPLRIALFYACALLASVRFSGPDLAFWALLFNALVMLKAHIAWDKYALPLLAWLWLLKSSGMLDRPAGSEVSVHVVETSETPA